MFQFPDNKRGLVLQSALRVFLTYGFKKTSMEDIANEAGVSRPALYQLFKNKTDIFRALSAELMENALVATAAAFHKDTDLRGKLFAAIDDSILEMHRFCDQSPHGMELIGVNQQIARDIELEWKDKMIRTIAQGIEKCVGNGTADLTNVKKLDCTAIARIIMHGMEGMRETYLSGGVIEPYVEELIDFVAYALQPTEAGTVRHHQTSAALL